MSLMKYLPGKETKKCCCYKIRPLDQILQSFACCCCLLLQQQQHSNRSSLSTPAKITLEILSPAGQPASKPANSQSSAQGAFTSYVEKVLPISDHLPIPCEGIPLLVYGKICMLLKVPVPPTTVLFSVVGISKTWPKSMCSLRYSRVRNKHTPTLINFLTFFQGLWPYSGLHRAYLSSMSIRYKWGYTYFFCQIFEGLRLFKGVCLFQTLEYSKSCMESVFIKFENC